MVSLLYREAWKDAYLESAQRAWDAGFAAARKGFDPDLFRQWIDSLIGLSRELIAKRVREMTQSTIDLVLRLIESANAEGMTVRQIAKEISTRLPEIDKVRAARIARTEVHAALNSGTLQGTKDMLKETGLTGKKVWISTPDERTRSWHRGVEPVGIDEPFQVGGEDLQYPGDPAGSAGNVINCRCALATQLEEPEWMR